MEFQSRNFWKIIYFRLRPSILTVFLALFSPHLLAQSAPPHSSDPSSSSRLQLSSWLHNLAVPKEVSSNLALFQSDSGELSAKFITDFIQGIHRRVELELNAWSVVYEMDACHEKSFAVSNAIRGTDLDPSTAISESEIDFLESLFYTSSQGCINIESPSVALNNFVQPNFRQSLEDQVVLIEQKNEQTCFESDIIFYGKSYSCFKPNLFENAQFTVFQSWDTFTLNDSIYDPLFFKETAVVFRKIRVGTQVKVAYRYLSFGRWLEIYEFNRFMAGKFLPEWFIKNFKGLENKIQ